MLCYKFLYAKVTVSIGGHVIRLVVERQKYVRYREYQHVVHQDAVPKNLMKRMSILKGKNSANAVPN
jgi:hypothetical protein